MKMLKRDDNASKTRRILKRKNPKVIERKSEKRKHEKRPKEELKIEKTLGQKEGY